MSLSPGGLLTPPPDTFPLESMAILQSVASNGIVNDWPMLRKILIKRINYLSADSNEPSSPSGDVSPTSTVVLTEDSPRNSSTITRMQVFITNWMSDVPEQPISVQRICELLISPNENDLRRLFFNIERCLSSSHRDFSNISKSVRRKSSRCSTSSSVFSESSAFSFSPSPSRQRRYSDTMISRTLKRTRGLID